MIWENTRDLTLTSAFESGRKLNIYFPNTWQWLFWSFLCLSGGKNAFTPTFSLQPWHKQIPGRQIPEAPHALSLHWSRKIPFGPSFPESSVSQNFLPVSSCCRDTRQWRNETGGKRNDEVTQILLADGRTGKLKINPYRTGSLYKQSSE